MRLEEAAGYGAAAAASRAARNIINEPAKSKEGRQHHHKLESVREANHEGHHIVIRTKYTILVDDKPMVTPLHIANNGQLRCHALPNYSFPSAVDLVKQLIDVFPNDFARDEGHGAHDGHGGTRGRHGTLGHDGRARRKAATRTPSASRGTSKPRSRRGKAGRKVRE